MSQSTSTQPRRESLLGPVSPSSYAIQDSPGAAQSSAFARLVWVVHVELELSRLSPELEEALHARNRLLGSRPLRKPVRLIEQARHDVGLGGGDGGLRVSNRARGKRCDAAGKRVDERAQLVLLGARLT